MLNNGVPAAALRCNGEHVGARTLNNQVLIHQQFAAGQVHRIRDIAGRQVEGNRGAVTGVQNCVTQRSGATVVAVRLRRVDPQFTLIVAVANPPPSPRVVIAQRRLHLEAAIRVRIQAAA